MIRVIFTIAAFLMIQAGFSSPVSAQTKEKIFGLSFGQGGNIKRCRVITRSRNPLIQSWILPEGVTKQDDGYGEQPIPCFTAAYLYKNSVKPVDLFPHNFKGIQPGKLEPVAVYWPLGQAPKLSGIIDSGYRWSRLGFAVDGALEALLIETGGLPVQDQMLATLTERFGRPQKVYNTKLVTSDGKTTTSKNAIWVTDEFHVQLIGVAAGSRPEGNIFGRGQMIFRTHKAQRIYEQTEKIEKSSTNF